MADALRFWEDIELGESVRSAPYEVTREAITAFASGYDPQPFHLDEAVARASLLEGLSASGWHTAAIGMRLYYDCFVRHVASMGAPGVDEVRWLRPVRPGDRLTLEVTITGKRPSGSRPDRGFIAVAFTLSEAAGAGVMTQRFAMMVARRGADFLAMDLPPIDLPPIDLPPVAPIPPADFPAPNLGLTAFFEEVAPGREVALGSQRFTAESIVAFARDFDPQFFHLDADCAGTGPFGELVASGWQTAACWMKHYVAARGRSAAARESAGLPVATGGPSPGFAAMKWLHPVRAGALVHYAVKVVDLRPLARPGWGLVTTESTGRAADGTPVLSFQGRLLWPMRPPA